MTLVTQDMIKAAKIFFFVNLSANIVSLTNAIRKRSKKEDASAPFANLTIIGILTFVVGISWLLSRRDQKYTHLLGPVMSFAGVISCILVQVEIIGVKLTDKLRSAQLIYHLTFYII